MLAKLPVGLFAPKYAEHSPPGYPFNPYFRDVSITSVAMTCRGEFSFIIAAFGIGEELLDEELYSAIVFAVLLSSISSPIILTLMLRYYNRLAANYLEKDQLDTSIMRAPLHLNIQVRSAVMPGLQISIKNCVNSLGLFVIDQRSWHPRGLDVVVATEMYAIDAKTMVGVQEALDRVESLEHPSTLGESEARSDRVTFDGGEPTVIPEEEPAPGRDHISERCEEIRKSLLSHPDLVDAEVKVLQWVPLAGTQRHSEATHDAMIVSEAAAALKTKETIDTLLDEKPKLRIKRTKMRSGPVSFEDAEKEMKKETEGEEEEMIGEHLRPLDEGIPVTQPVEQQGLRRRRPRRVKTVSSPAVGGLDLWTVSATRLYFVLCNFSHILYLPIFRKTPRYKMLRLPELLRHLCNMTCKVEWDTAPRGGDRGCLLIWV